eukprot:CAMPEP_0175625298 /NCGR_PEP_ID=MMETSP0096-20121207/70395_1 /TAXON_ID=311494 /ORGANISM="Alexandrium monilatum, Strain CCMP3105" /LENGTH=681 /DNA_ID=CAMNT_0016930627 /DNA_START=110 /DNA_END=2153 /DNA_ORIENTATION=-
MASDADKFAGVWIDAEGTLMVIQDSLISARGGQPIDLVASGGRSCFFRSGDQEWRGELTDPHTIKWDDGDHWIRKGSDVESSGGRGGDQTEDSQLPQEEDGGGAGPPKAERGGDEWASGAAREEPPRDALSERAGLGRDGGAGVGRPKDRADADADAQRFAEEKARKTAALERARAARTQHGRDAEEAFPDRAAASRARGPLHETNGSRPPAPQSEAAPVAPAERAGQLFQEEKAARTAAALERARARSNGRDRGEEPGLGGAEFEEAKARSELGVDRARRAFEEERARKAAALERARARAAGRAAAGGEATGAGRVMPDPTRGLVAADADPRAGRRRTAAGAEAEGPAAGFLGNAGHQAEPKRGLATGEYVKIVGLAAQPELNGQIATLVKYFEDRDRWQARIPGRASVLVRAENLEPATAEEKANARRSPGPPRSRGGKGGGKDSQQQPAVELGPDEGGNHFDVELGAESSMHSALEKLVDALARRGVCTCEANSPLELLRSAYDEASALWEAGEFEPPCSHMDSRPEEKIWHDALFQSEDVVHWVREDTRGRFETPSLQILSENMWCLCRLMAEELQHQMGIAYTHLWSAMLSCYHGDKTYSLHLDNPNGVEAGIPDNGLRLSMCYYLSPYWVPGPSPVSNCAGGLDVHLTEPWETPSSLAVARRAPVMRIAPHADTL